MVEFLLCFKFLHPKNKKDVVGENTQPREKQMKRGRHVTLQSYNKHHT
jgi:hypothetical protein